MRIHKDNFVQRLKKRDEKALEYVLEEYGGLLLSIIKKHLFYFPWLQEECMNDVLFKIWRHIEQFDEQKSTFKNWSAGIARYQSIDYLRKYRKELEQVDLSKVEIGREDSRLTEMIDGEISEELEQMLSCLTVADRQLFLELFLEERNVEEVSKDLGIKKEAVYQRVSRGKKKMLQFLEHKEGH